MVKMVNLMFLHIYINIHGIFYHNFRASLVAQMAKNLSPVQETQIGSLGREDLLQKGMATHFQYSGLENPMDRRTWQTIVHGVTKCQT